jgi:hypothetical protein
VTIEVFYIEGCPHHQPTVDRIKTVLREANLPEIVAQLRVAASGTANIPGFLGSPTVRVNGLDVDLSAREAKEAAFGCRIYINGTKREGVPPVELIREAIELARSSERHVSAANSQGWHL